MKDKFNRTINYLRISVIDRCNLHCIYCMPENNFTWLNHEDILSFEEIVKTVKYAVQLGINKIRLTGGEPLVRRDITNLVKMIADIEGIKDFAMTTNGILLSQYAETLKKSGLHRVNVSLDTLNAERFYKLTRGGNIQNVLDGIKAAQMAQLTPIKLNCIVDETFDSRDRKEIQQFAIKNGFAARFIQLIDLKSGKFSKVEGGSGGDCLNCNRLRLLSEGTIKPCLFSNIGYNIRKLGIEQAFKLAIENKPKAGTPCTSNEWMYNIGG